MPPAALLACGPSTMTQQWPGAGCAGPTRSSRTGRSRWDRRSGLSGRSSQGQKHCLLSGIQEHSDAIAGREAVKRVGPVRRLQRPAIEIHADATGKWAGVDDLGSGSDSVTKRFSKPEKCPAHDERRRDHDQGHQLDEHIERHRLRRSDHCADHRDKRQAHQRVDERGRVDLDHVAHTHLAWGIRLLCKQPSGHLDEPWSWKEALDRATLHRSRGGVGSVDRYEPYHEPAVRADRPSFEDVYRDYLFEPRMSTPAAWLFRIARNATLDHFRAHGRRERLRRTIEQQPVYAEDPAGMAEDRMQYRALLAHVAQLSERQRDAISLRHSGLSFEEVGTLMSCSEDAAKMLYHRALKALRDAVAGEARMSDAQHE
ncbi:MAG: sigma-70 family RNA polymerase sigma factor [Chloroflexi bacterium]|nr:MAG: sigma-70 family RNA polymerase sigma factor [Chloroflexota bacterium]